MVLLKNLSIRWKLSLALIVSGLTLVLAYVYVAKNVFESDKISYVFETQNSSVESLKQNFTARFEHVLQSMEFVTATYDPAIGKPTAIGMGIFKSENALDALELVNDRTKQIVFKLEKTPGDIAVGAQSQINGNETSTPASHTPRPMLAIKPLQHHKILVSERVSSPNQQHLRVNAIVDLQKLLPPISPTHTIALTQNGKLFYKIDFRGIPLPTFQTMAKQIRNLKLDTTSFFKSEGNVYLASAVPLGIGGLQVFELTPEKEAFGALNTLFNRSLVFLFFSFFALVIISLILSRSLTWRLGSLTTAADQIGQGKFDVEESDNSRDEVGILTQAFVKMSKEIKRLLSETREKARMEEELKTAKLVQERLLPEKPTNIVNEIEISGTVITSSECGGDWWYYFVKGDSLYVAVADATGHGTPAALITAAARAVFSRLETEPLTLAEMAIAWDHAISSCSGKQVLMTGLLLKVDTKTGEGAAINCSHELPMLFHPNDSGVDFTSLEIPARGRLGDGLKEFILEEPFQLERGDYLLIYTDGLWAIENSKGQTLSDRRFAKNIRARLDADYSAPKAIDLVVDTFNSFRADGPIPDDFSAVVIRRVSASN